MSDFAPTTEERIPVLDFLRGVAILGILLANIYAFAIPVLGKQYAFMWPVEGVNDTLEGLKVAFVTGKFRGLLGLLFGIGIYLQYEKLKNHGWSWPFRYIWRNTILLLIGYLHITYIWFGDIVFQYAAVAFVAMWGVKFPKALLITLGIFLLLLKGPGLVMWEESRPMGFQIQGELSHHVFRGEKEADIYQTGSYLEQVETRAYLRNEEIEMLPYVSFEVLGLMLLGIAFAKSGILINPSKHRASTFLLVLIGAAGLGINLINGLTYSLSEYDMSHVLANMFFAPPLSVGYVIAAAIIAERFPKYWLFRLLSPVGRTALTCYILTSVICTTFFYGWGFGQYAQLNYYQILAVVLVVWTILIVFAHLWMRRFRLGPIEYLWRKAAYIFPPSPRPGRETAVRD